MTSSDVLHALLALALVVYVIGRQLRGEQLKQKRVVVLPAVLAIIGLVDLVNASVSPTGTDLALLAAGGVVAAGIGVAQGLALRLEERNGWLWGKLPVSGLWLWLGLVASRVAITAVASAEHAHVASSTTSIFLILGINRLAQAAVIVTRAQAMGVAFAPEEKSGGRVGPLQQLRTVTPAAPATPAAAYDRHARHDARRAARRVRY